MPLIEGADVRVEAHVYDAGLLSVVSGMASLVRPRIRQTDIVDWFSANRDIIRVMAAARWKTEKGVLEYLVDAKDFIADMRQARQERKEKETAPEEGKKKESSTMAQYYESQELLKKMKWKRVSWDEDATYDSFARRIMDNDTLFSHVKPMSHLSIHLVHDKTAAPATGSRLEARSITSIKPGTLTSWYMECKAEEIEPMEDDDAPPLERQPPFTVDWESGLAKILDSASAQEILTFIETTAPRVQALQKRMDDEQTKLQEDIDNARVRLGVTAIKYNKHDRSFWDDPVRRESPDDYVTPQEMRQFLDAVNRRGFLLRKYVKGNQLRVLRAGKPYELARGDDNELRIPANFEDYNFLGIHARYEALERIANFFRASAVLWFFVVTMFVGDFEIL